MGIKPLLHEVMNVMGKDEPDADAVDMASDVLKLVKAREMLKTGIRDKTRLVAMKVIARSEEAEAVFDRILERRRTYCSCRIDTRN